MDIYLCRHGQTEWTITEQHTSKTDLPLTLIGENQARTLQKVLPKNIKAYSSPLKRAVQTAHLAGTQPEINPDLTEWNYGDYEGLTTAQIGPNWNLFQDGAPNGESPEQVSHRADRFLHSIKDQPSPIAIFCHGHFSRVLAARWLKLSVSHAANFYLSVASLSLLGYEHTRPVIRLWNSTAHLT